MIECLTQGLLSSHWNIYHSTTAYFFEPPCISPDTLLDQLAAWPFQLNSQWCHHTGQHYSDVLAIGGRRVPIVKIISQKIATRTNPESSTAFSRIGLLCRNGTNSTTSMNLSDTIFAYMGPVLWELGNDQGGNSVRWCTEMSNMLVSCTYHDIRQFNYTSSWNEHAKTIFKTGLYTQNLTKNGRLCVTFRFCAVINRAGEVNQNSRNIQWIQEILKSVNYYEDVSH